MNRLEKLKGGVPRQWLRLCPRPEAPERECARRGRQARALPKGPCQPAPAAPAPPAQPAPRPRQAWSPRCATCARAAPSSARSVPTVRCCGATSGLRSTCRRQRRRRRGSSPSCSGAASRRARACSRLCRLSLVGGGVWRRGVARRVCAACDNGSPRACLLIPPPASLSPLTRASPDPRLPPARRAPGAARRAALHRRPAPHRRRAHARPCLPHDPRPARPRGARGGGGGARPAGGRPGCGHHIFQHGRGAGAGAAGPVRVLPGSLLGSIGLQARHGPALCQPARKPCRPRARWLLHAPPQAQGLCRLMGGRDALAAAVRAHGVVLAAHGPYTAAGAGDVIGMPVPVVSKRWAPAPRRRRRRRRSTRQCFGGAWRLGFAAPPCRPTPDNAPAVTLKPPNRPRQLLNI
jgi:hypothetical protein